MALEHIWRRLGLRQTTAKAFIEDAEKQRNLLLEQITHATSIEELAKAQLALELQRITLTERLGDKNELIRQSAERQLTALNALRGGFESMAGAAERVQAAVRATAQELERGLKATASSQEYENEIAALKGKIAGNPVAVQEAELDTLLKERLAKYQAEGRSQIEAVRMANEIVNLTRQEQEEERAKADAKKNTRDLTKEISALEKESITALRKDRLDQALVGSNPFAGVEQQQAKLHELYQQEQRDLERLIQTYLLYLEAHKGAVDAAELQKLEEMRDKLHQVSAAVDELHYKVETTTFTGQLGAELIAWVNNFGTAAHQVAGLISGVLNTAISSASQAITGLIFGTKTWQQTFYQAAQSIVQSIIQVVLQFAAAQLAMFIIRQIFGTQERNVANKAAAQSAAAWAPAATSASIASYGAAAGFGVAAYVAALAVGEAAAVGVSSAGTPLGGGGGGYMVGGYTGDGNPTDPAGTVHKKEFVFSAPAVETLGLGSLQNLHHFALGGRNQPESYGNLTSAQMAIDARREGFTLLPGQALGPEFYEPHGSHAVFYDNPLGSIDNPLAPGGGDAPASRPTGRNPRSPGGDLYADANNDAELPGADNSGGPSSVTIGGGGPNRSGRGVYRPNAAGAYAAYNPFSGASGSAGINPSYASGVAGFNFTGGASAGAGANTVGASGSAVPPGRIIIGSYNWIDMGGGVYSRFNESLGRHETTTFGPSIGGNMLLAGYGDHTPTNFSLGAGIPDSGAWSYGGTDAPVGSIVGVTASGQTVIQGTNGERIVGGVATTAANPNTAVYSTANGAGGWGNTGYATRAEAQARMAADAQQQAFQIQSGFANSYLRQQADQIGYTGDSEYAQSTAGRSIAPGGGLTGAQREANYAAQAADQARLWALYGHADGGRIPGAPSTTDNHLAWMATGEHVINSVATEWADKVWGPHFLDDLNAMRVAPPRTGGYAEGGRVGGSSAGESGSSGGSPQINQAFFFDLQKLRSFIQENSGSTTEVIDLLQRMGVLS
ncbi:MAG: hypothetical protein ACR2NX_14570 [Chthoniobacterales bacterium]